MNWRIKLVLVAWLIAAIAGAFLVRNLMLGKWKDLPVDSPLLLSLVFLLFSSSYLLLKGVPGNSK